MKRFNEISHKVDFCVVGGGMAGLCAAVAAARNGACVALMHDRPVLGGNASSECRMHITGADRHNHIKNMRETGILEELRTENLFRNRNRSFSMWDTILYEALRREPDINLLLNCSCLEADVAGDAVASVTGWQLTTQTYHHVDAAIFADCSGDGVLAPLTGAEFRMGREARREYGESLAPEKADDRTMGMTCLFQSRELDTPQPFYPPEWAYRFDNCDELPRGAEGHRWWGMGYWWLELGGEHDSIRDTERLRDELLRITFGVWDHIKNRCPGSRAAARNWALEWVQFLPAKRESRRYVGEHVLTQNDIEAEGRFDDIVAYGGWTMDDHHPAGFNAVKVGAPINVFHPAPSPYGIPYRCLYSRNVSNLMFAGRDASCTHMAMSSTRVMGTACSMGQAAGTAAALAVAKGLQPAAMKRHIPELQQRLLGDDAYLPRVPLEFGELTTGARLEASNGDPTPVRDGINRPVGDEPHCWFCRQGDWIAYTFAQTTRVALLTVVMDSALDQLIAMSHHHRDVQHTAPPGVMPKGFRIEGLFGDRWRTLVHEETNHHRFRRFRIEADVKSIRFVLDRTWGAPQSRLYAFYLD